MRHFWFSEAYERGGKALHELSDLQQKYYMKRLGTL
jgi:hypothetical protein